jgi:hypothetical protein
MNFSSRSFFLLAVCCAATGVAAAQQPQSAANPDPPVAVAAKADPDKVDPASLPVGKRVLGVLPNYRTANYTADYHPISKEYKMKIALKDSFDYPLFFVGGAYAGLYQLENSHPQFGQGTVGYFKRLGTSYADQVIGNMMTEGIMPILLHEDPRYFRIGRGTKWHRTGYALSRIFVTRTDTGAATFNFAEVLGNGIAAGIGLSYYQDSRDPKDYLQNWGTQLATDAISQVLKEFWPDIKHHYFKKHAQADSPAD